MTGGVVFTMSMSVGQSFAGGENGNAVSVAEKEGEGLRGRKARKNAGRGSLRLTRSPRPRFRGDFCLRSGAAISAPS